MAFKENLVWPAGNYMFDNGTFNVDQAVGGGYGNGSMIGANRPTDMQLVYYFIFMIYRDGDRNRFPSTEDDWTKTPYDRDYSSWDMKRRMHAVIRRFQSDVSKQGFSVYVDGRCDRARGTIASYSKTAYTIHHANFHYSLMVEEKHGTQEWQEYMLNDPEFPEQARWEIRSRSLGLG